MVSAQSDDFQEVHGVPNKITSNQEIYLAVQHMFMPIFV